MSGRIHEAELGALVETLLESQAMMASFFYIEMINRGLIGRAEAAARLRVLGRLVGDERQTHRGPARDLASKLDDYANAIAAGQGGTAADDRPKYRFSVVEGGKA